MAKTKKIWMVVVWTIIIAAVLNGIYFYLSTEAVTNTNVATVATIATPILSAINYVIMGFVAGLGFYLAKEMAGN